MGGCARVRACVCMCVKVGTLEMNPSTEVGYGRNTVETHWLICLGVNIGICLTTTIIIVITTTTNTTTITIIIVVIIQLTTSHPPLHVSTVESSGSQACRDYDCSQPAVIYLARVLVLFMTGVKTEEGLGGGRRGGEEASR